MTDIAQKLRALADEIEREPKSEAAQPWPPKGVAIEMRYDWLYLPMVSAGDDQFYAMTGELESLRGKSWRYAPAPWDIAPEWAKCWVVTSLGESFWSRKQFLAVGYKSDEGGTIVHVEYRLSEAFPKEDKGETEG